MEPRRGIQRSKTGAAGIEKDFQNKTSPANGTEQG
jgi:hypothetical protein